jgi:hypothetical protein
MEKVLTIGLMVKLMMDNGFKTKWKVMVNFIGQMELFIKDIIRIKKNMEKAN